MIGLILILSVIVFAVIKLESIKKRLKYFEEHGIAHAIPTLIVGNMLPFILRKKHMYHIMKEYGEKFSNEKYFGFFEFLKPIIVIIDPDLVKEIGVKTFNNFMNRREVNFDVLDRDFYSLLPFLIDDNWRKVRVQSDAAYTKVKCLDFYPILMEHVDFMMKYYEKIFHEGIGVNENGIFEENASLLANNFAIGIIASQVFGEEFNTFNEQNKNKLILLIRKYSESLNNYRIITRLMGWTLVPKLMGYLKIRIFPIGEMDYLFGAFSNAVNNRLRDSTDRSDFCQTVVDLIKKSAQAESSEINNTKDAEELIYKVKTQALIIILAGADTSAAISSNLLYELTKSSDIQDKLREEIDNTIAQHGECPSWEVISHMRYLEMIVAETLRKWPQTFEVLHRYCNKDTIIEGPREGAKRYLVRKGDAVWLSTVAMHYNKKYWKNPEIFDPERFNEVNRPNIYPYSYFPFGVGPRICLGYRFVPLILKSLAFHLLAKYQLVKTENFNEKLDYLPDSLSLKPETCHIGIMKRLYH